MLPAFWAAWLHLACPPTFAAAWFAFWLNDERITRRS